MKRKKLSDRALSMLLSACAGGDGIRLADTMALEREGLA